MGIFSYWIRKKRGNTYENPEIQEESMKHAEEMRQLRATQRSLQFRLRLKQAQDKIDDLQAELDRYGPEPAAEPDFLQQIILSFLTSKLQETGQTDLLNIIPAFNHDEKNNPAVKVSSSLKSPPKADKLDLSDEEIKKQLKSVDKKHLKLAKKFSDEIIKNYISKNFDYSEDTINRAIIILRNEV